ncbi:hypothetical protein [Curtobacterium sp. MCJR17_043]|uniref:hypothetical protein n=1 Tax=Curtobacterium sp. MCJR17_043 TaxID=2175660 RepID=UPI0024DF7C15|nr:hypothetical protein [Curtobacterium sp. MCJR17_043]WIB34783.1 hypothetical protein DEJ15_09370 [Curtobacterium sp. MCJR17_043]
MTPDLPIPDVVQNLTPFQALMIPVALVGAVFLSLGAQFQSRGVQRVEARLGQQSKGLSVRHVLALLGSGNWVLGTLMLGAAIVLQLVSITYAPLIVVQPLGAVALVVTTWFSSRSSGVPLGTRARRAVWTCIGGVGLFVLIAALYGRESPIGRGQLITVLVVLAVVLGLVVVSFRLVAKRRNALYYIIGAGVLYGFVATLAKVTLNRIVNGTFDWVTVFAIVGGRRRLGCRSVLRAERVLQRFGRPGHRRPHGRRPHRRRRHRRDRPRRGRRGAGRRRHRLPRRRGDRDHGRVPAREAPPRHPPLTGGREACLPSGATPGG